MVIPAASVWKQSVISQGVVILGAWIILAAGGCAHQYYRASGLPPELAALPTEKIEPALLSRLARYAASNELIERGDLLEVTVDAGYGENPERTSSVRVAEDGTARIPLIGTIALGGLTLQDAERAIAAAAVQRELLPDPYVSVTMKEQRKNQVTVLGAVSREGVHSLPRGSSYLLNALVAAGGLTESAGPEVEIRRPARPDAPPDLFRPGAPRVAEGPQAEWASYERAGARGPWTIRVNLVSAANEGNEAYYLENGDVVVVSEREPRSIHVMGLVKEPGEHKLPFDREVHVLEALAMAKGRTTQLADKVLVVRQLPDRSEPVTIITSVRKAKQSSAWNMPLAGGDVVSVEETPATFAVETLRSFVRFGVSGSVPLF